MQNNMIETIFRDDIPLGFVILRPEVQVRFPAPVKIKGLAL
jgi:hypothetical protein